MTCIKTGFHAYLESHNEWLYGDAFEIEQDGGPGQLVQTYVFRICARGFEPHREVKHFTIRSYEHWFDHGHTSMICNSTMICTPGWVTDHGYDGVPI